MKRKSKVILTPRPRNRKRVTCYCSDCHGKKQVDPRTKRNHETRYLPGSGPTTSNVTDERGQSDSNLSRSDSWESENSRISDSDIDAGRLEVDVSEDDIPSGQISTRLSKAKFKEPPPSNQFEANVEDEVNVEDDSLSSSQNEEDLFDDSDDIMAFNFNKPQIDPEIFNPTIQFDQSQPHEWVILWLMKFQKQFNIPDTGFDALVKFIRQVFQHYHIKDADRLPTSIFTAKSSLSFSTKYREYGMCQECFTLYNPADLKNYKEDDQPTIKKCDHVEFPQHRSKKK